LPPLLGKASSSFRSHSWAWQLFRCVPRHFIPWLQLNISGIIGPALGGVLLYFIGANWVFAVNALGFVVVVLVLLQWKGPETESQILLESFVDSFSAAVRYVRYTPAVQVVLVRNVLFAFFISVIPALVPVIEGTSPSTL
jgi:MFS family permease